MLNTLIVGGSQCGKSTAQIEKLKKHEGGLVICDPHNSLAKKYMEWVACEGDSRKVVYDDLSRTDICLGWNMLVPSKKKGVAQEKENEDRARQFAEILCRRRGLEISQTPLIEEWSMAALQLWLFQKPVKPLTHIIQCFTPFIGKGVNPRFKKLVDDCQHEVREKFQNLAHTSHATIRGELSHTQRLFEATILSVPFRIRCDGGFDFRKHLDKGGTIVVGGDRDNRNATRVMLSTIVQKVMEYVRGGGKSVHVVIDEANNFNLIGRTEVESLAEDLKSGLRYSIITQTLNFGSDEIIDGVLSNCLRHEWFRCSHNTARIAAEDLAIPTIRPDKTKAKEYRKRQVFDGHDRVWTGSEGYSEGMSEGERDGSERTSQGNQRGQKEQLVSRYKDVEEEVNIYESYNEQILRMQQMVMRQETGERIVREGREVWSERVSMKEVHPWGEVAESRGKKLTEKLIGVHGIRPSSKSSKRTASPSNKQSPSDSSKAAKQLGQDSTNFKKGKAVNPFD